MKHPFELKTEMVDISCLKPDPRNARVHSKKQITQIAASIERFGFVLPILIRDDGTVVSGNGTLEAAKLLGRTTVPVSRISHLSPAEANALALALNRIPQNAGWDMDILAAVLAEAAAIDVSLESMGFDTTEVDKILADAAAGDPLGLNRDEDEILKPGEAAVIRPGELIRLGRHAVICADARTTGAYERVMEGEKATAIFADAPYNVKIKGNVSKLDRREFAMASGEMTKSEFIAFLTTTFGEATRYCCDGAIVFSCMDWHHAGEMIAAGEAVFSELKNICVWVKKNAGMGSFYRSQQEFVFVFKVGTAPHINTFGLGAGGRHRSNCWSYAGVNGFKRGRAEELAMHPTVKPVALVEDAIKDVTHRNNIVLDPFAGSGTTLIAAERCGRRARLIEIDPLYCDVIARRYERYTGKAAVFAETGETFEAVSEARGGDQQERADD